ncbi:acetoin utilization protein AcuC [Actinoalloteichus hymeniacidonis]|uniref:Acetoin utilization protein AcuC n=1 Tax=Actinoalloteichus hymeniacidonis TaxID=340345 RepID=A0AAC9MY26_9PSEU|nr:acetoin utilization protein AcuC [Actinoalloteichus hymeniacidonis]AOS62552.1 deacetylase, histone deacetylase/acetoin utilization protein [Actinoalloteichus hymeniacidonis]MBB5909417.1 acetoin utilization protein AcuC [Actinoalloteichus hymeniacidonis]
MVSTAIVWDEALLGYDLGPNHPLAPIRLDLTMRLADALGVLTGVRRLRPDPADDDLLATVHRRDYLAAVRAASNGADRMPSGLVDHFGLGTVDNPVFPGMHDASALIAGASVAAAREILEGRVSRAVNIAGGLHHAMSGNAAGFCVYNDCAVAIAWLLDQGVERIAYLDVDVHHGDGVQAAFYHDPRVLTVSVHQHPRTLWPGTGLASDLGGPAAPGRAVNLALPPGTSDAGWQRAFHAVVPSLLAEFEPQILVTQCGVDTHREDPLADLSLTVDGHRTIYRTLRALADTYADGRWLALGGGGYALHRVVPRSWTHLLAVLTDRDLDPDTAVPAEWRSHAQESAGGIAMPMAMTDRERHDEGAVDTTELGDVCFTPWDGDVSQDVDRAVLATRRAAFPLYGLDPEDRRD